MNCLYCQDACNLTTDSDIYYYRYRCNTCIVDYCFIEDLQGHNMTRIIFDAVVFHDKLYRILLDLESNKTWLGVNVDIGGLNYYETVYEQKELLRLTPQNVKDKIKTILVFS